MFRTCICWKRTISATFNIIKWKLFFKLVLQYSVRRSQISIGLFPYSSCAICYEKTVLMLTTPDFDIRCIVASVSYNVIILFSFICLT